MHVSSSTAMPAPARSGSTSTAQPETASASETASPSVSVARVDPAERDARLQTYLKALGAPLKMGQDASRIAEALVSTLQTLMKERPDLATASFDFKSADGALQVVSQDLSEADRQWLEDKLNANADLRDAAAQFHDDAVTGYTLWANADGNTLTAEQSDAVSRKADDLTGFMTLFSKLGADAAKGMFTDGAYVAPDGSRVGFGQDPTTAEGFLSFARSAKTLADGTARWIAPDGGTHYGVLRSDLFANDRVIPNFFPKPGDGLGLSRTV